MGRNLYGNGTCCLCCYKSVFTKGQTSEFPKKQIFQFDLDAGMSTGEIDPGDIFSMSLVIFQ